MKLTIDLCSLSGNPGNGDDSLSCVMMLGDVSDDARADSGARWDWGVLGAFPRTCRAQGCSTGAELRGLKG